MDPLNDPRFPDRPTHPDFWRLSEIVTQNDGDATEGGKSTFEILGIDEESFMYFLEQRLGTVTQAAHVADLGPRMHRFVQAVYIDAFAAGKKFAERGGHQEP